MKKQPILLDHPRAWRSYLGGALLDELLGAPQGSGVVGHFPEEWIASTVQAVNPGREDVREEGLSHVMADTTTPTAQNKTESHPLSCTAEKTKTENRPLPCTTEKTKTENRPRSCPPSCEIKTETESEHAPLPTLNSLIDANPTAMLGAQHAAKFGAQMGVLVKLIDSAERLTIQVHPNKEKARTLFQSDYGKTECWHILGTREMNGETPCVYFGFKEGITRAQWEALFYAQDIPAMLNCLHRCPVQVGDTIFIEGGVPHAIGAGCFLVEIQEPTDYTLRTERTTPSGFAVADALCHQGLGFEAMFDCFDYTGYTEAQVRAKWFLQSEVLVNKTPSATAKGANIARRIVGGAAAEAFFSMQEYLVQTSLPVAGSARFSGMYVLEGAGTFANTEGEVTLQAPAQYFLPADMPDFTLTSTGDAPLRVLQFWGPAVT